MITKEQRAKRLRRHMDLKQSYEVQLGNATTDAEKKHLEARIAEISSKMKPVTLPEPKALLPEITKTAEEAAKKAEEHIVQPLKPRRPGSTRKQIKIKQAGNPF